MTLIRLNTSSQIDGVQDLINSLFQDSGIASVLFDRDLSNVPAAEIQETEDAIHVKLELPGVETKDLDVQVTENAVHISGERKSETKTDEKGVTRSEFNYGKFQRVIPLSVRIQNTKVKADYKNGILNLILPKTEQEKNKVVKINLE
ncbi:Hsp20/alpha crystallin family protein [Nostoc edaphicum CCNP1411]|uniref:Hsp20/alpha crystallin family protein n=1 Tax=Nostoc edaphicum CCNP1411 TaxID=1472755 RepID=A0A7D7QFS6_9NOSO|nr:Hsp20/alpha crystallin family protein [Nostoc edaphicum]QMS88462.1 Hsp20/alpha crystallin family protein [Nostoc edaphicum CCNP1411]